MASEAANLVDHVFPSAPLRQWVVSFPYEMRLLLAKRSDVLSDVIAIVMRLVQRWYADQAKRCGVHAPKTGGVVVVQRFGGSLNLHVHLHIVMIDGAYGFEGDTAVFHFVPAPTPEDMHAVATALRARVVTKLTKQGLVKAAHDASDETDNDAIDQCRQVGLGRGRFEKLDRRGRSQQKLFDLDDSLGKHATTSKLEATVEGFSVEAGVVMSALNRQGREKLLRYCLRPCVALERLTILRDGNIAYRTKYGRGGKTHRVMTPMECMARLASLVPPPRRCLLRYHGILAPHSKVRALVVPKAPSKAKPCATIEQDAKVSTTKRSTYIDWPTLMRRTFAVDVLERPKCHSAMTVLAMLTQPAIVDKVLAKVELPEAEESRDRYAIVYDVTDRDVPTWLEGTDPVWDDDEALHGIEVRGRGPPGWME